MKDKLKKLINAEMAPQDIYNLVATLAANSKCKKRKVGAAIITNNKLVAFGYNMNTVSGPCEENGKTVNTVLHAEQVALNYLRSRTEAITKLINKETKIYVSFEPCLNCRTEIRNAGINKIIIVPEFMKFDKDKLRYELIPPIVLTALAKVLTYGAEKYKPHNWKNCIDTDRWIGAFFRHIQAWRDGEIIDPDSGLPHLDHALTNLAFLVHLDYKINHENYKNFPGNC
jgi:deoxycytidylate deaminase